MKMPASQWLDIEDSDLGTARVEVNSGMAFLHLTLKKRVAGFREARKRMPSIKAWLKERGFAQVHVIIPEGDDKLYRFERAFGFTEVKRAAGQILLRQEC